MKNYIIIALSSLFTINICGQFSKTYDFVAIDFGVNLHIDDTSYNIVGNSILDWNNYKSIIFLKTDTSGETLFKSSTKIKN